MRNSISALVLALLLCGCVTPPLKTPSGAPEVVIQAPSSKVHQRIENAMAKSGFQVTANSDQLLVVEKPGTAMQSAFWGSAINPTAYVRFKWGFIPQEDGSVRLTVRNYMVRNRGTSLEVEEEAQGQYRENQSSLEKLKAELEGKK